MTKSLLEVENLTKRFTLSKKLFGQKEELLAVDRASSSLDQGEALGIVGESGSGKPTLARCIIGLYQEVQGKTLFDGRDLVTISGKDSRRVRPGIQMVFQNPYSSLSPRFSAGNMVLESLRNMPGKIQGDPRGRVKGAMELCGLPSSYYNYCPHEFSGGQRQRIGITRVLMTQPDLVILDEPTSTLDISIQTRIIDLLRGLQKEFSLTCLFISHGLAVVANLCHDVAVMKNGKIVERGSRDKIFIRPQEDYTKKLLRAVPINHPSKRQSSSICSRGEV